MSLEQVEKEYLKYLQKKYKEGKKSRVEKVAETQAALPPTAIDLVTHPPSGESEPEVVAQTATKKRGRKPKKISEPASPSEAPYHP
jgi:hypothetical protein